MDAVKKYVKRIMGYVKCLLMHIPYAENVYIGRRVHVVNGRNIKLGKDVQIRPDVDLFAGAVFEIGDRCDIGIRNRIVGNVVVEDSVLFGPDNYICSEDHCYEDITLPIMDQGTYSVCRNGHKELKIGSESWIGTHVAIIGDVHIGKHCVIGANSVVIKDIPDYCVAVGIPAKIIKRYNVETQVWESSV